MSHLDPFKELEKILVIPEHEKAPLTNPDTEYKLEQDRLFTDYVHRIATDERLIKPAVLGQVHRSAPEGGLIDAEEAMDALQFTDSGDERDNVIADFYQRLFQVLCSRTIDLAEGATVEFEDYYDIEILGSWLASHKSLSMQEMTVLLTFSFEILADI